METIKLKKEHKKVLEDIQKEREVADIAFQRASSMMKDKHDQLWKFIYENYPASADYSCTVNIKKMELTLKFVDIKTD